MSDIALKRVGDIFDIQISKGDLVFDDGLETAATVSLFTDRRVSDEEIPDGTQDKRGWWGDMVPDVDRDQIGSRLWTLRRSKKIPETLRKAEDYAKEALEWMIEDGVAKSISATASFRDDLGVGYWDIDILIAKPDGDTFRFRVLWDKQALKRMI